ncbi:ribosome maturation factor RimM [Bifidobacterium bombi]|uniref:Ribosome maturation factor RimM n=1 Tax=Bifidobacterium bombi DSM 19703 TaxID=1341695 RepID=A0A086BNM1_9BIFI|nr:ribosome maturation factor RimM [Bifidobacterium bombi]KFF30535.1 16S rRNA processing protein RimM [Bifidobacterium bombi DSM 19703]
MNGETTGSQQVDPQQHELLRVCRIGRAQGLKGEVNVTTFTDDPERRYAPDSALTAVNRHIYSTRPQEIGTKKSMEGVEDAAARNGGDAARGGRNSGNAGSTQNAGSTVNARNAQTDQDIEYTEYSVQSARIQKNRWVLKLSGVNDRTAAEALNGTDLYVQADDAEEMMEEDAWYPKDLLGLTAILDESNAIGAPAGQVVGKVVDVNDTGAQWLLKIRLANPPAEAEATALVPFVDAIVPQIDLEAGTLTLDPPGGLIPGL